ncbi:MAG TPA: tetratricopeptide repeat protein [Streptosporangiaceae bacterium]|nr:tetratricopeptide repeat protein [Streptosporangiaceae bacterium]
MLRRYRLAAGMTQEELAARSGLSVRGLGDLERNRSARPYLRSVRLLAAALGLTDAQRAELVDLARGGGEGCAATEVALPSQLPAGVAQFVGRERELQELDELLDRASQQSAGGAIVISAIGGTAGIGKTALAVHWARRVSAGFPDGQLYVDLRGFGPSGPPLAAAEAVGGFLAALGVAPQGWPPGLDARAGLYRSLVAGKRLLIVLDNARDSGQVRPLLPGSPGCLVVITSRAPLGGLAVSEGAHLLTLDVLSHDEAYRLLAARLGAGRVAAQPGAVSELIELSAGLPLALAIVSARASARPGFALAGLAAELRDEPRRLDALDAGDLASSVRGVFSWSYDQLSRSGARLFRLLGLHPGPDFTVRAAASLAGITPARARRLLEELARASLFTERAPGRFGCHDLLHAYAIELAAAPGSGAARRAALGRLLDYYLHTAAAASLLLYPLRPRIELAAPQPGVASEHFASHGQALAWLDAEHRGLVAAVALAAGRGFDVHAWQLAFSLEVFFFRRGRWDDWAATQRAALAAACRLGDRHAQALAHRGIASAQSYAGCPDEALSHQERALQLLEEAGDIRWQVLVQLFAGRAHLVAGRAHQAGGRALEGQERYREALARSRLGLRLARSAGPEARPELAEALNMVGWTLAQLGRYRRALTYCQRAVALDEQIGNMHSLSHALDSLAYVYRHLGRHSEAAGCYRRAIQLFTELGDTYAKAETLAYAGDAHRDGGDLAAARQAWKQAVAILDDLHHPDADTVRAKLAPVPAPRPGQGT